MKINRINTLNGPNYWSIRRHKLIVMELDLQELEEKPTNKINGFLDRLKALLPNMYEHRCSEGAPGGFYKRVEEGTWMGHVIEHIALEIQTLAGMDCGFGRTRTTGEYGVYHVVFDYQEARVGAYAARAAVRIAEALVEGRDYSQDLKEDIQEMREMRDKVRLGPSTSALVEEAQSRGIPWIRLNQYSLVQLGYGQNQKRIQATVASTTSNIAVEIACDKEDTKNLLESYNVPVPRGRIVRNERQLADTLDDIGYPVVLKPINGNHGKGATINVKTLEEAKDALRIAQKYSTSVVVERFVHGHDYRLLVINYRFVAAALRTPAAVTGDGVSSIRQLVDAVNRDPRRGLGHENVLTEIKIDDHSLAILAEKELTTDSILPAGEVLYLKKTANLSTGGTSTDVTDIAHPYNVFMAERIARIVGLDICGIDLMTSDISLPVTETGGCVLEVNAAPGFRMHTAPTVGLPRNVAEPVIDMLFPPGTPSRIPIIAVTGTNGKTTTTRLTAHLARSVGYKVGFTTSDGIYIQNRMLEEGDCTGPRSTEFVLKDPTVNFAVLECARGGLLKGGLGYHYCNVAIVTNVAADHLGMQGINTLEDMARVKSVIAETVLPDGYAILNADDQLVYDMRNKLSCKIGLYSVADNNPRIVSHCKNGGMACVVDDGYVTICKGEWKIRVEKVTNIPLTFGGKALFNVYNVLPSVLAGFVQGFKVEDIREALLTFIPSPAQTPGRMNLFNFRNLTVMLDYAHNAAGFQAIKGFVEKFDAVKKVGIVAGVGDRRDEDTVALGVLSAQMFDEIIIRQDRNLRGRTAEEIIDLITSGIKQENPSRKYTVIPEESEAILHGIKKAEKGSLLVICSDVVPRALALVRKLKEDEDSRE